VVFWVNNLSDIASEITNSLLILIKWRWKNSRFVKKNACEGRMDCGMKVYDWYDAYGPHAL
ncbi:MAG: hypothetical protein MI749_14640, partial [Desulfovibrionales bacterium]|nr:hypothetical protein [Desulfovibrionales bacterium]